MSECASRVWIWLCWLADSRWQLLPLASHAGEFRSQQAPNGQLLSHATTKSHPLNNQSIHPLASTAINRVKSLQTDCTRRNHAATDLRLRTARTEPTAPSPRPSARLDGPSIAQSASALITGQLWIWAITRSAGSGRRCWLQQHAPSIRRLHGGPHHQDGHGFRGTRNQCWTAVHGAERMLGRTRYQDCSKLTIHPAQQVRQRLRPEALL